MSDVKCPHCGTEQEINHDDGYGYEEGERHEQECSCGKEFGFTTDISYSYEVFCEDDKHDLELNEFDKEGRLMECTNCDHYELKSK